MTISDEKLEIVKNLLLLRNCFSVVPKDMENIWVTMLYGRQRSAADKLVKFVNNPVVVTALADRGLQMPQGKWEWTDEYVRSILRRESPEVSIPLCYAMTSDPDEERRTTAIYELGEQTDYIGGEADVALAAYRASVLAQDDPIDDARLAALYTLVEVARRIAPGLRNADSETQSLIDSILRDVRSETPCDVVTSLQGMSPHFKNVKTGDNSVIRAI